MSCKHLKLTSYASVLLVFNIWSAIISLPEICTSSLFSPPPPLSSKCSLSLSLIDSTLEMPLLLLTHFCPRSSQLSLCGLFSSPRFFFFFFAVILELISLSSLYSLTPSLSPPSPYFLPLLLPNFPHHHIMPKTHMSSCGPLLCIRLSTDLLTWHIKFFSKPGLFIVISSLTAPPLSPLSCTTFDTDTVYQSKRCVFANSWIVSCWHGEHSSCEMWLPSILLVGFVSFALLGEPLL